ncbi:extracellular solute-binding protein [Haloarcula montana]|uniref:extracellular solute-binding protein n=1 Tax=Haloarcula montana TaxID=3111776 RepID=UPI002D78FECB|nr:extracellular solute-binding protein [Haloarcula sp. GH36]
MGKQRGRVRRHSRRQLLRTAGIGVAGVLGGCLSSAQSPNPVSILSAGSLQYALENGLKPTVDVPLRIESHGSATVARLIDEGQRDPDIVAVADTALFDAPLSPPWYSAFASNAVVLAYNPDTSGGQRMEEAGAERWYVPLVDDAVSLGRTDPDQDPLGYRTLFVLELASRYYDDAPDLRAVVPTREQRYPETGLLSQFETGSIDAAFAYRNMAVERGYDYVSLPNRIDLSDRRYADEWYSTTAYELPSGQRVEGGPIEYGATIRTDAESVRSVFERLTTGAYLDDTGFVLGDRFPRFDGDVPGTVSTTTTED